MPMGAGERAENWFPRTELPRSGSRGLPTHPRGPQVLHSTPTLTSDINLSQIFTERWKVARVNRNSEQSSMSQSSSTARLRGVMLGWPSSISREGRYIASHSNRDSTSPTFTSTMSAWPQLGVAGSRAGPDPAVPLDTTGSASWPPPPLFLLTLPDSNPALAVAPPPSPNARLFRDARNGPLMLSTGVLPQLPQEATQQTPMSPAGILLCVWVELKTENTDVKFEFKKNQATRQRLPGGTPWIFRDCTAFTAAMATVPMLEAPAG